MKITKYLCMKFSVFSFQFVDDEPGVSFGSRSDCPQASQSFCESPSFFGKDILTLSVLFILRGGGRGRDWSVENKFSCWDHHRSRMYFYQS